MTLRYRSSSFSWSLHSLKEGSSPDYSVRPVEVNAYLGGYVWRMIYILHKFALRSELRKQSLRTPDTPGNASGPSEEESLL